MKDLIRKILKEDTSQFSGWVNVKIDNEVVNRVKRLMIGLGFREHGDLTNKIKFLAEPTKVRIREGETVGQVLNRKISAIMLLQYLKEIRNLFDPSPAGFLFESFMAGLLGGEKIPGNLPVDVKTSTEKYQIKLLSGTIDKVPRPSLVGEQPTKYVLGLKKGDFIEIYEADYDRFKSELYVEYDENGEEVIDKFLKIRKFKDIATRIGILDLSNIDDTLGELEMELKDSTSSLWDVVSDLQFNIEAMLTGINKVGGKTTTLKAANAAQANTKDLDNKIGEIKGFFKPRTLAR